MHKIAKLFHLCNVINRSLQKFFLFSFILPPKVDCVRKNLASKVNFLNSTGRDGCNNALEEKLHVEHVCASFFFFFFPHSIVVYRLCTKIGHPYSTIQFILVLYCCVVPILVGISQYFILFAEIDHPSANALISRKGFCHYYKVKCKCTASVVYYSF